MTRESKFFFYADQESTSVLASSEEKVIVIGSDFGYGNFGDVMQHRGTIAIYREVKRHKIVGVVDISAVSSEGYLEFLRNHLSLDAIIVVSPNKLQFNNLGLVLQSVQEVQNITIVHLYGGGFLNERWGEYVLGVCETVLDVVQPALYIISGQQISKSFVDRVIHHIKTYTPALFGVRDELSLQWMSQAGFVPMFSFDDATEELQKLQQRVPICQGNGIVVHLNSSDYTDNHLDELTRELNILATHATNKEFEVTLVQAYADKRIVVCDTRETIKAIESHELFHDYRTIELTDIAYNDSFRLLKPINCQFGYSCSYHVALWLQLANVPCWLRAKNQYYVQKRLGLKGNDNLEEFLANPHLVDHTYDLERRSAWMENLFEKALEVKEGNAKSVQIEYPDGVAAECKFKSSGLSDYLYGRPSSEKIRFYDENSRTDKIGSSGSGFYTDEQIIALNERITALGAMMNDQGQSGNQKELREAYDCVINSASWRITKPLRLVLDLLRHNTTDKNITTNKGNDG